MHGFCTTYSEGQIPHLNVYCLWIRNDSARTLYITMIVVTVLDNEEKEEKEEYPANRRGTALAARSAAHAQAGLFASLFHSTTREGGAQPRGSARHPRVLR
jgi:hypothetical protein